VPVVRQKFHLPPCANFRDRLYATDINTIHGQAITFHYNIFFPSSVTLNLRSDMKLMLHELEHTAQYERKGGERAFISEYLLHSAGQVISRRSIDIHDFVATERDAIARAAALIKDYGWNIRFKNDCHKPVRIALRYKDGDSWVSYGYWTLDPKEATHLIKDDQTRAHTANRLFYWYGEIRGTDYKWAGDHTFEYKGTTMKGRKVEFASDLERLQVDLNCSNLQD
jgi:uncharacterized membrane protein